MTTPREFVHVLLYWDANKYQNTEHYQDCNRYTQLVEARDAEIRAEALRDAAAKMRELGYLDSAYVIEDAIEAISKAKP